MKTVTTIIVWICYLICINMYILTFNLIQLTYSKLLYLWPGFFTLLFCAYSVYKGIYGYKHKCFISLCMASIAGNFLIMIMYFQFGIDGYFVRFISFNGLSLLTSICILVSGTHHKYFDES